nr:hypothetical protein [Tanacetum cinerariifolium]
NKKDERGIVVRNKARLVTQGHTQEEGIDYAEVFAPVARIEAIMLFLAYASFMGFMVYLMDVKSAFLYETIEEEVYVCQPSGFEDNDYPDKAPRAWYETLANYLLENGFHRGKIDQTLFIKKQKGDILLVQIYVDDIIFGATNKDLCKSFEKLMKEKFQMSLMGETHILFRSSASTPIDTEKPLLKDPDGKDVNVHIYKSMIGSLIYLTSSRPDIMFAQKFVATSSTEAEYVAAASCCTQVLWIQNQLLDYGLQALVDRKKVVVTEAAIRDVLRLDDAKGVDCLPNEDIFVELARMGYEKPSTKLTLYKAFFLSQWKFLIHTILQSISAKRTSWNEFSSAMASAVICLSTGKGCSRVETPLFEGMLVAGEPEEQGDADEQVQGNDNVAAQRADTAVSGDDEALDACVALTRRVEHLEHDKVAQDLKITKLKTRVKKLERANKVKTLKLRILRKVRTSQRIESSADTDMKDASNQERMIDELDRDTSVALMVDEGTENKVEDAQEAVEVVTTAKLITEVVAVVSESVSAASATIAVVPAATITAALVPAATITAAPVRVFAAFTKRRKGVVIMDPEKESTTKTSFETKFKDKGKGIMVEEPKPIKKKQQVKIDEVYARKLHDELNQDIDWSVAIDHVKQKAKEDPYVQRYQVMKKRPQTEAQARRNM